MTRRVALLALACLAPGCGAARPAEPVQPPLAYDALPDPNPAPYTFHDSLRMAVEADGAGELVTERVREGTAELLFQQSDGALLVEVRFPRLSGGFFAPDQDPGRIGPADIEGPVRLRLHRTGRITVVDTPSISPALLDLADADAMVRPLFALLPDSVAGPAESWVDTLSTQRVHDGNREDHRTIVSSRLAGDTVVDGLTALRILTRTEHTLALDAESGGVDVELRLSGEVAGQVLYDPDRRLLVARHERGQLQGTLAMPDVTDAVFPVRATLIRSAELGQ